MFIDEAAGLNYIALFFSERWWREQFDALPPGLVGAGSGLALGEYYVGPSDERVYHPLQRITPVAYAQKGTDALWTHAARKS